MESVSKSKTKVSEAVIIMATFLSEFKKKQLQTPGEVTICLTIVKSLRFKIVTGFSAPSSIIARDESVLKVIRSVFHQVEGIGFGT